MPLWVFPPLLTILSSWGLWEAGAGGSRSVRGWWLLMLTQFVWLAYVLMGGPSGFILYPIAHAILYVCNGARKRRRLDRAPPLTA